MKKFAQILCIITVVFGSCQRDQAVRIEDFYFPVGELKTGKLYTYRPVGSAPDAPADYWFNQTIETDTGTYLHIVYFDQAHQMRQFGRELVTKGGTVQKELILYEKEPHSGLLIETPVSIMSGTMFPYAIVDTNTMVIYDVRYVLPGRANLAVSITRNRRYGGEGPDFQLNGKTYPTIKMWIVEKVASEGEGSATLQGIGEEWYAKGLGRVYYKKSLGDGQVSEEYELRDVKEWSGVW